MPDVEIDDRNQTPQMQAKSHSKISHLAKSRYSLPCVRSLIRRVCVLAGIFPVCVLFRRFLFEFFRALTFARTVAWIQKSAGGIELVEHGLQARAGGDG